MTWRPARSLTVLHTQLKAGTRAAPPATAASAWGTVGDLSHQQESTSDHNPRDFPGWANDVVTACDFPHAPALGLNARTVLDSIRRSRDPRVKYGISNGQMFSSYATSSYPAWTWRPYGGSDGHFDHGHLSVVGDARADDPRPWQITPEGEFMASASEVVMAIAAGLPKTGDGTVISPTVWRIRDEARQGQVLATLQAIAKAQGVAQQDLDDIQARVGTVTLTDAQVRQLAVELDINPDDFEAAARRAIRGQLDDNPAT